MQDPSNSYTSAFVDVVLSLLGFMASILGWLVRGHDSRIKDLEATRLTRSEADVRRNDLKDDVDDKFNALIHSMDKQFESLRELIRHERKP